MTGKNRLLGTYESDTTRHLIRHSNIFFARQFFFSWSRFGLSFEIGAVYLIPEAENHASLLKTFLNFVKRISRALFSKRYRVNYDELCLFSPSQRKVHEWISFSWQHVLRCLTCIYNTTQHSKIQRSAIESRCRQHEWESTRYRCERDADVMSAVMRRWQQEGGPRNSNENRWRSILSLLQIYYI